MTSLLPGRVGEGPAGQRWSLGSLAAAGGLAAGMLTAARVVWRLRVRNYSGASA